jgi:hypothetical protein
VRATAALAVAATLVTASCMTRAAEGFVSPTPGGAGAWATGGALLADPVGAGRLFDLPSRIAASGPERWGAGLEVATARLFALDELARTRLAVALRRDRIAFAAGHEVFGPVMARRSRTGVGMAARMAGARAGVAFLEARAGRARGAALDASVSAEGLARGRLAWSLAARSLLTGGAPEAVPDPDWTVTGSWNAGAAVLHLAATRDLVATQTGGGIELALPGVRILAGAVGPPWSWCVGFGLARGGLRLSYGRSLHPVLGVSEAWDAGWTR